MLKSRLPKIALELEVQTEAVAREGAALIAERAKNRVPVDTGRLRDAIHVAREEGGFMVVAGNTEAFYGHIVEHGGVGRPAHPFLIPAAESSRKEIQALGMAMMRRL